MAYQRVNFSGFFALEDGIRQQFSQLTYPSHLSIKEFNYRLVMNDGVQFYWHIATAVFEVDDIDVSNSLLRMIVELFYHSWIFLCQWMD